MFKGKFNKMSLYFKIIDFDVKKIREPVEERY